MTWWADGYEDVASDDVRGMQVSTHRAFGDRWVTQTIENARIIGLTPPASCLRTLAGLPAVVVSPGPSLAKNGHLLREAKGRAVICASSHCLSTLAAIGVMPDLVMQLDALPSNHFNFGVLEECGGLVTCGAAFPLTFSLPFRRKWVFTAGIAADGWLMSGLGDDESAYLPSGGCVAGAQLSLLLASGCSSVALVGQDLALTEGGSYYNPLCHDAATKAEQVEGAVFRAKWLDGEEEVERVVRVPGYYGGEVLTTRPFEAYRAWFCHVAGNLARDGNPLVNCTEGGARIDHAVQMPFAEWLEPWPACDIEARLTAAESYGIGARSARMSAHRRGLCANLAAVEALARVCHAAAAEGDGATVERVEGEMRRRLGVLSLPLSAIRCDEFDAVQQRMRDAQSDADRLEASVAFYVLIAGGAALMRAAMESDQ